MDDWIIHNSHDLKYRNPFGAVKTDTEISLGLRVKNISGINQVRLIIWQDSTGEKEEIEMNMVEANNDDKYYLVSIKSPSQPGLLWYYFGIVINGEEYFYGNNVNSLGGIGEITKHIPPSFQITVYHNIFLPPNWFKDAIVYQIFVDRFYNGNEKGMISYPKKNSLLHTNWDNDPVYIRDEDGSIKYWDFFGGNLPGVIKKLPYLKELGITSIYLNPIFEAPSNHKYDTGDYHKVDPMFGDNQLFKQLCAEADKYGISIILDGVFSHTGSDSIYFNKENNYDSLGAYQSDKSPYYRWYRFNDYPYSYESWWGIEVLPNVNELEPSYQDFIIFNENSVLKYWQRLGVKGWRLDVADELPDRFIRAFKKTMKEVDPDTVLVGEVWEDASNKISYGHRRKYLIDNELDSVTNYPLRQIIIDFILGNRDAKHVHDFLMKLYENYPLDHFYSLLNIVGSHDTPRILSVLQDELPEHFSAEERKSLAIKLLQLVSLWQMTFPGVPLILYGDEAGLEGVEEPLNRRTYPWGRENKELLIWYRNITALRKKYDIFKTGKWISFYQGNNIYGYVRMIENGRDVFQQKRMDNVTIVLFNRNIQEKVHLSLQVDKWFDVCQLYDYYRGKVPVEIKDGQINLVLNPLEGKVLLKDL